MKFSALTNTQSRQRWTNIVGDDSGLVHGVTANVINSSPMSIDNVSNDDYIALTEAHKGSAVKQSEFVRWLKQFGATFEDGANHVKVKLHGRTSFLPRHPAKELKTGLVEAVKKQLKLK